LKNEDLLSHDHTAAPVIPTTRSCATRNATDQRAAARWFGGARLRWEILGTACRNSASRLACGVSTLKRGPFSSRQPRKRLAQVLLLFAASTNVFRAALLSIVLTLAAGQNAALLCDVWCHSGAGMTGTCEHQTKATTPGVGANDDCAVNGNAVVFVREDGRPGASAPDVAGAVVVARFAFRPPAAGTLSAYRSNSRLLLELRPLVLALRI